MNCRRLRFGMPAIALAGLLLAQLVSAAPLPNAWQITDSLATGGALNYATNLPSVLQTAATNSSGSFNYSVNARFVTDFGGAKALFMAYGLGNRRFLIWWELDGSGDLTAELEGGLTYLLTTNGMEPTSIAHGNPAVAPSPVTQGWTETTGAGTSVGGDPLQVHDV